LTLLNWLSFGSRFATDAYALKAHSIKRFIDIGSFLGWPKA